MEGNLSLTAVVGAILVLIILAFFWPPQKVKTEDKIKEYPTISPILPRQPSIDPATLCALSSGKLTKCGSYTKDMEQLQENQKIASLPGFIPELKLHNQSPIKLDIFHRPKNSKQFVFVCSIPTMQYMYVYKDRSGTNFYQDDELFATQHKGTKILYLSVPLVQGKPVIKWGDSSSDIDEGQTIVNLIGEIGHVKVRNYSLVPYKIFYYGEYLGVVKPYDKENNIYSELYINRIQGFRLTSRLTFQMQEIKGPVQAQGIELNRKNMTLLNIGLVTMEE
jgi:hypothetical protein